MTAAFDFERYWQGKLSNSLEQVAGPALRNMVMIGGENLKSDSPADMVIDWTRKVVGKMEGLLEESEWQKVLSDCGCPYPQKDLLKARSVYASSHDIDGAQRVLHEQFESLLRDSLHLDESLIAEVVKRGWGAAGVRHGNRILATKIPKSRNLEAYMAETDPSIKRQLYCHCPRIRQVLKSGEFFPSSYCYCGAGFYKGIWEGILQQPVRVELVESVLRGDEVCTVAIHLPL